VSKDEIAQLVWTQTVASDASLARCVHTLRRRLADASDGLACIGTDYARGYRLLLEVRPLDLP
jgi:DNA-binding winged helix-turn-helix (wHTH) protein